MAAQQFTLDYAPDPGEEVKKDVVITTPLVDPGTTEIWVGFGTDVATRRGSEIINAMSFLMSGIRDRNLLDSQFSDNELVTACSIDSQTESNRRTSSSLATSVVLDIDVVIAMGTFVTATSYKVFHETHFEQLKRAVIEWLHKNG